MSYVPPRGSCGFKPSLMSSSCACLRFMIHPLKAATSFECDGCGHHASFHKMENPVEDSYVERALLDLRMEEAAASRTQTSREIDFELDVIHGSSPKRRRLAITDDKHSDDTTFVPVKSRSRRCAPPTARKHNGIHKIP